MMRLAVILLLLSCNKQDMRFFHAQNKTTGNTESGTAFYIVAGQSNCGRSVVSAMTAPQAALYDVNFAQVKIYNRTSGLFEQINPGSNTLLANPNNADEFGPEVSLMKSLQDYSLVDRYLLKYGVGNTDLAVQWASGSSLRNNLKTYMTDCVTEAQADGKNLNLKAIIWMQGENDAVVEAWADAYEANLSGFASEIRTHWNSLVTTYSLGTPTDPPFIIGRINGASDPVETYRLTVRAAQASYCSNPSNNAVLIDTDSYPLMDDVHYSATGQIEFGIDIYDIIKDY